MKEVLINKKDDEIVACVLEDNKLCERYIYSKNYRRLLGNIYVGRVDNIIDGMQAAFINIGEEKNAFMSVTDAMPKVDVRVDKIKSETKMSEVLSVGQKVIVQVKKEPCEEKGARVSTHITLPGKYVVIMPETDIITISQKIVDEAEKERLKNIVTSVLPKNFGAIIRTDAENVESSKIEKDLTSVLEMWKAIKESAKKSEEISMLYDDNDLVRVILRDVADKTTKNICTNDELTYNKILAEKLDTPINLYNGENLIEKFLIQTEYDEIENRKIWLKCGGQIVIDKAEALTAIDVNSGKCTGKVDLETTIFKVNLEAAEEIMKQLRLKDIGGIVVIDFIDMKDEEHKKAILEVMKKEAKKDRSKVDVKEFTQLNLVELTRKKMYL